MKRALKSTVVYMSIVGATILVLSAACFAAGARINTTKSIPVGLYWTSNARVEKGAYVLFCPPRNGVFDDAKARGYIGAGYCPGGYGYMMKRILAVKDDTVTVNEDGVRVNGEPVARSVPLQIDAAGRSLPRLQVDRYTLGDAEVLLMSDVSGTSFDGRYFGPINRSQVETVIRPVITW